MLLPIFCFKWTNKVRAVAQTKLKKWQIQASVNEQVDLEQGDKPY